MINENTLIEDLVQDHPKLVGPLADYGLVCIRCGEPVWGTLKELAEDKGVKYLDEIIGEMNEIICK
ncbi:MAG: DUF1858 domain-containing protein [Candidatus Marinimicrobia bacterium]|nr:DUF1858 domain-containing protein [Candidatus Neomarinimicrobiota bacterium]